MTNSNLIDFIGGKEVKRIYLFDTDTTLVIEKTGFYTVICQGAGASGGARNYSTQQSLNYSGGAGELKSDILYLTKGTSIPITIGVGGASVSVAASSNAIIDRGNSGSPSSFGSYLTANGGNELFTGGTVSQSVTSISPLPYLFFPPTSIGTPSVYGKHGQQSIFSIGGGEAIGGVSTAGSGSGYGSGGGTACTVGAVPAISGAGANGIIIVGALI